MPEDVSVPPELEPLFRQAQAVVGSYFSALRTNPAQGTIEVSGERYVLVRAAAMSVEFSAAITQLYQDQGEDEAHAVARSLLYDVAYALSVADARAFHTRLNLRDPIARLSAGPIHFAHTGWARVAILPESRPVADEQFLLVYDHPYSFEADAWRATGHTSSTPVCVMNAGYSAGWCTESFGLGLVAVEISCRARGDEQCRFVMAPANQIEPAIARYLHNRPALQRSVANYEIPGFFRRKQAEDELREREQQYRGIFESVTDAILIVALDGRIAAANPAARRLYEYVGDALVGMSVAAITAPASQYLHQAEDRPRQADTRGEALAVAASGRVFEVEFHATPFVYRRQPHTLVVVNDISARKQAEAEQLRLREQLLRQNERLREESLLAQRIQRGLLPQRPPWNDERLRVVCRSLPANLVSRDFYSYIALDNQRRLLALGDIAGKGVAAALVMALVVSAIETQVQVTPQPAALLAALQARLADQLYAAETSVALLLACVDLQQGQIVLANAGMPQPHLLRHTWLQPLDLTGLPLGIAANANYPEQSLTWQPGDQLLLTSDGLIEARNLAGELFGYQRLRETLSLGAATAEQQVERLLTQVSAFAAGAEQRDDQTILLLNRLL